jgi:methyl-accepting chemotaxis protein
MVKTTEQGLYNAIVMGRNTGSMDRERVIELLKSTLENSPSTILALYTLWEPNEFDGKDNSYINKKGYDATGRFIPYIVRSEGKIIHEPLLDYETEGAGDYYLTSKKTKEPALIEPYLYKIDGKDVLITSLIIPIKDASGKFQGIVGADIALSWIQEKATTIKPMGGFTSIISSKGIFAGHGLKPELVSKNVSEIEKNPEEIIKIISSGEYHKEYVKSTITGEQTLQINVPISITGVKDKWSLPGPNR